MKKTPVPMSALQSLSQYDDDEGEAPSKEETEKVKAKLPVPLAASTAKEVVCRCVSPPSPLLVCFEAFLCI